MQSKINLSQFGSFPVRIIRKCCGNRTILCAGDLVMADGSGRCAVSSCGHGLWHNFDFIFVRKCFYYRLLSVSSCLAGVGGEPDREDVSVGF